MCMSAYIIYEEIRSLLRDHLCTVMAFLVEHVEYRRQKNSNFFKDDNNTLADHTGQNLYGFLQYSRQGPCIFR